MSVPSISGLDSTQSVYVSPFQNLKSDFSNLSGALASGNLDQAQQAFGKLQNDLAPGASNGPLGQALSAVGQALQNGDVEGANQALQSLQVQFQSAKAQGHHHGHHGHHQSSTQNQVGANGVQDPSGLTGSTGTTGNTATSGVGSLINTQA